MTFYPASDYHMWPQKTKWTSILFWQSVYNLAYNKVLRFMWITKSNSLPMTGFLHLRTFQSTCTIIFDKALSLLELLLLHWRLLELTLCVCVHPYCIPTLSHMTAKLSCNINKQKSEDSCVQTCATHEKSIKNQVILKCNGGCQSCRICLLSLLT